MHHFAALLGYGACAVNPYLALETIRELIEEKLLDKDYYAAVSDYNQAVLHGIVKIASKMGISTIQSYQGSKIFEAIGYFPGGGGSVFRGNRQPGRGHYPGGYCRKCGRPSLKSL